MTQRLREGDCLNEMRVDLERQAATVQVWDADGFGAWISACGEVLAAVPDELQRVAWAWSLAQAVLKKIVGIPQDMVTGRLLHAAEQKMVRR